MKTLHNQVKEFILAGEQLPADSMNNPDIPDDKVTRLGVQLIDEEFHELRVAIGDARMSQEMSRSELPIDEKIELLTNVADAIGDLLYVAAWNGLAWGLPMPAILDEIQRSNMAKFGEGSWKDETGKVRKPPGWTPPDIAGIIRTWLEKEKEHG